MSAAKASIIMLDDEETICDFTRSLLERTGKFQVTTFTDPQKGWEAIRSTPPDLVVLDVNMPGMDGGEVAQHMLEDTATAHVPVIFLTALIKKEEETDQTCFSDTGKHFFIAKPVASQELIEQIEVILSGKGTKQEP